MAMGEGPRHSLGIRASVLRLILATRLDCLLNCNGPGHAALSLLRWLVCCSRRGSLDRAASGCVLGHTLLSRRPSRTQMGEVTWPTCPNTWPGTCPIPASIHLRSGRRDIALVTARKLAGSMEEKGFKIYPLQRGADTWTEENSRTIT